VWSGRAGKPGVRAWVCTGGNSWLRMYYVRGEFTVQTEKKRGEFAGDPPYEGTPPASDWAITVPSGALRRIPASPALPLAPGSRILPLGTTQRSALPANSHSTVKPSGLHCCGEVQCASIPRWTAISLFSSTSTVQKVTRSPYVPASSCKAERVGLRLLGLVMLGWGHLDWRRHAMARPTPLSYKQCTT
jgi:hypothetical protein